MSTATIVVPCYNEAQRLPVAEFRQFAAQQQGIRFLFVNDGSRDDTLSVLERMVATDAARFELLDLPQNGGKAEAVRQGILHASAKQTDYIGFWDADLATPLHAIPEFTAVLDRRPEIMVLLGVRMPLLGHAIRRRTIRRWIGKMFAKVASMVLRVPLKDTQCGAKIFRNASEVVAAFSQPFQSRWIFDVELLARLICLSRRTHQNFLQDAVFEFPIDQWEDVAGSKLKRGDFFKAVGELWGIWWRYLRPAAPPFVAASVKENPRHSVDETPRRRAA
jgi:dolichyl-phosphate beta-glucosyltransferase